MNAANETIPSLCGQKPLLALLVKRITKQTSEPTGLQLIEATPWGRQPKYLIRDRDACYGGSFNSRATEIGINCILTPVHSPKANALAERVIGSLRRECLDHVIILNQKHLQAVLSEYVAYYNLARPHRSLSQETPTGPPARAEPPSEGRVLGKPILGGLHHEYEGIAA